MKTTYWLVTAAAVAAAGVVVYARLPSSNPPLPKVALAAEAPREVPRLELPPVVLPPDEPLALPPLPVPATPVVPPPPIVPVSANIPADPPVPIPELTVPALPPIPRPGVSRAGAAVAPPPQTVPVLPTVPTVPVPPAVTPSPVDPAPPVIPFAPPSPAADPPPPVVAQPKPIPLPAPSVLQPPVAPAPAQPEPHSSEPSSGEGRYVVLKDDKLIEGAVSVGDKTVVVRQGAIDLKFPKSSVQFVTDSRDKVYRFMLAKVPAADAAARLQVARWCMFSGLREQALIEAHEVRKLQPMNRSAGDMIRSLELSLQQFPPEGGPPKMTAPPAPTFPAELRAGPMPMPVPSAPPEPHPAPVPPIPPAVDPEPDVTPEAALVFGSRVQPFLANQCIDCHAKADYAGKFKLVRVDPSEAGPQATHTNLLAAAGQLKKDDPGASPLLMKSLSAHGGMKRPAVASRQATAYLALEAWAELAIGTPVAAPPVLPVPPRVEPLVPPSKPVSPTESTPPPVAPPVKDADPVLPPPPPISVPIQPLPAPSTPPVVSAPPRLPTPPVLPAVPPAIPPTGPGGPPALVPPPVEVLPPTPPILPPAPPPAPAAPPFIPPAGTKAVPPAVPPIPPAATVPKPPSPVVPVTGQFGTAIPPKPPATGPTGGDEFDPAGFNQQPKK